MAEFSSDKWRCLSAYFISNMCESKYTFYFNRLTNYQVINELINYLVTNKKVQYAHV